MGAVLGIQEGSFDHSETLEKEEKHWKTSASQSREFLVLADYLEESEESLLRSAGLPTLKGRDGNLTCKGLNIRESSVVLHPATGELTSLYTIAAEYDSEERDDEDPLEMEPTIRWTSERYEEEATHDAVEQDKPIATVPGEPILVTSPHSLAVLSYSRYEPWPFDYQKILQFVDSVNESSFGNAPPKCVYMDGIDADQEVFEIDGKKVPFAHVTYRFKFKMSDTQENSWVAKILHQGTLYFPEDSQTPKIWTDDDVNTGTVNLDADGHILPADQPPVFLEFNLFKVRNFNQLGIV